LKLDIPYLLENLTLEEKAGLCSGADFWHTKAVERLGLPAIMVTDGPHGLRKQEETADHVGIGGSVEAVCFPAGSALAASFDRDLLAHVGGLLGEEARAENVHTLLGPAINIKRSPLCGRNFEYMSEDPFLAGELSASYVNAVQGKNVGVSVKHYAANNQEYRRMSIDTLVDERTLREIYLKAFEITVRKAKPWTLMCAYNHINGVYCCENEWLLTDLPRKEWGFDGIVMTDWGAMNDRVKALKAGLNLEMPSSYGYHDKKLVAAVKDGGLGMDVLDGAVRELLVWIERGLNEQPDIKAYDKKAHHEESRKAAAQCAVLLKNEGGLLPLDKALEVAFIGPFARTPRYQGGGSSHINAFEITGAVDAAAGLPVRYLPGTEDDGLRANAERLAEAVAAAKAAKAAVLFVGLPDSFESEGYDRKHMDLPEAQNLLIEAIAEAQPNTVVVLHNGSPVCMPWKDNVKAILEMYLGGQAVGGAAVDLLYGDANPCGKLAETFPLRLEDTPCYLQFGDGYSVTYGEGVYVGYRWYDSRRMDVLYPFGHGLSYTGFSIGGLAVSSKKISAGETVEVSCQVRNTGTRAGAEVVQLYIAPPESLRPLRPAQELRGFEKTYLEPGEEKTVTFSLEIADFAYYKTDMADWYAAPGEYTLRIGNSSRSIAASASIEVAGPLPKLVYSDSTTIGDFIASGQAEYIKPVLDKIRGVFSGGQEESDDAVTGDMLNAMLDSMPIHSLPSFGAVTDEELERLVAPFSV
jgi:beta-glucosidase